VNYTKNSSGTNILVRHLGHREYLGVWDAMKTFTDNRSELTPDALWFVEHDPVFTQGQAGKAEHLLAPGKSHRAEPVSG